MHPVSAIAACLQDRTYPALSMQDAEMVLLPHVGTDDDAALDRAPAHVAAWNQVCHCRGRGHQGCQCRRRRDFDDSFTACNL